MMMRASDTHRLMPVIGDVVAGKYLIVRVLGEGGMGIVYEATHQRLRQRVAIKMLLPTMLEHHVVVSRFDREARAAAQLRSRHVARVHDVDVTEDGLPYMVMDFLEGHDLQVELERRRTLPVEEAVDYILQACSAMVEAHQLGIVHRDLKPSNLFLEHDHREASSGGLDATPRIVKVLDFGISKLQADADAKLTEVDTVMGTALYMSPEQIRASHAVDGRADIWALGVILYEVFAGRVPWLGTPHQVAAAVVTEDAPDLRTFCPSLPQELTLIIHKCLSREPANRFPDVRTLAVALAPFAAPGSPGRAFADNIVATGSFPRVSSTPSNTSLKPAVSDDAKTVVHTMSIIHESDAENVRSTVRMSGSDSSSGTTTASTQNSHNRAALIGVGVAFVVTLLSLGGVMMFMQSKGSQNRATALPTESSTSATPEPSTTAPSTTAPSTTPSERPAAEEIPGIASRASSAAPPTTPNVGSQRFKVKPVPTKPPSASPTSSPPAPTTTDRPLFL